MSKMVEWRQEDCYLCNGSGRVWKGYGVRTRACNHRLSLESWEDLLADAKEELDKATWRYNELLAYDKKAKRISQ